jgi:hypothetical protein
VRCWVAPRQQAGAAATVAALIPSAPQPAAPAGTATAAADKPLGYQLSEHVKRYYATARI